MGIQAIGTDPRTSAAAMRSTDRAAIASVLVGGLLIAAVVGTRCGAPTTQLEGLSQALREGGQPARLQVGYQPHELIAEVSVGGWEVAVLERSSDWARVRGPNGQEGWVPAPYLKQ